MSQFWYLPCFFGANEINQKIQTVRGVGEGGQDYMTDFSSWLAIQNGIIRLKPTFTTRLCVICETDATSGNGFT
jgi:hypothetical protein